MQTNKQMQRYHESVGQMILRKNVFSPALLISRRSILSVIICGKHPWQMPHQAVRVQ
jgi:hypothetical protein